MTTNFKFHLLLAASVCAITLTSHLEGNRATYSAAKSNLSMSFYDFEVKSIDGATIKLSAFKGKKVLIVNTASECGFTPQYESLQKLYEKMNGKLVVIGFPSNDFAGQEPGSNAEISTFCKKNYGVSFPLTEKVSVTGEHQAPLYTWLTNKKANGWNEKVPSWNFCKYLINEKGTLTNYWPSKTDPLSAEVLDALKR